jgi:hypothetical protein
MSAELPLARSEGLITEELGGELLVYDSESNMAHALEPQAAAVWRACDGRNDTQALAAHCGNSEAGVRKTLARLGELGLLEHTEPDEDRDTRRSALRKIGIAGVGVATISSIVVPAAAAQGSCVTTGTCLTHPGQNCCSGQPPQPFPFGPGSPGCQSGFICCVPPGQCATTIGNFDAVVSCCSGNGVTDFSCPSAGLGGSGIRCT